MRQLIVLVLLLNLLAITLKAQENTPDAKFIRQLQAEAEIKDQKLAELQDKSNSVLRALAVEKNHETRDENLISRLHDTLNQVQDMYYQVLISAKATGDTLRAIYRQLDTLKTTNAELLKIVAEVKAENHQYKNRIDSLIKTGSNFKQDNLILSLYLSWISSFSIGSRIGDQTIVEQIFDSTSNYANPNSIFKKPHRKLIGSHKLDAMVYQGKLCFQTDNLSSVKDMIGGKIIVYSNDRLVYVKNDTLKLINNKDLTSTACYDIQFNGQVPFEFESMDNMKLGFIPDSVFQHLKSDDFENFWEANGHSYFTLTSLMPVYKIKTMVNDQPNQLLEDIVDTIFVNEDRVLLSIYDNATFDGDIATFTINNEEIIKRLLLRPVPYQAEISLPNIINKLTMTSNFIGEEGDCTGYIVIQGKMKAFGSTIMTANDVKKCSIIIIRTDKP